MSRYTEAQIKSLLKDQYGLQVDQISELPSGINYVCLLQVQGQKLVLKDYVKVKSPHLDQVHARLVDLMQAGLPIPTIIPNSKGEYLTKEGEHNFDLSEFVEHVDLSDQINISDDHLKISAEALATLQKQLDSSETEVVLDKFDFEKTVEATLEQIELFKQSFDTVLAKASETEQAKLSVLKEIVYQTDAYRAKGKGEFTAFLNQPFKPTHGDYSMVNVLIDSKDEVKIIDWDSLKLRPYVWDLQAAVSLFSLKELGNAYIVEPDYHKAELFLKAYLPKSTLTKEQLLLLPEVVKYNFAIYWLSYTLPAVNEYDFRLLFLVPDSVEKGLYWLKNLEEYREFISSIAEVI